MTEFKAQTISYKMNHKTPSFKIAIFDLPTEIEDAPFYDAYANWVSCHDEAVRQDLQTLIYNKTTSQLKNLGIAQDYFEFTQYQDMLPIEADTSSERLMSLSNHSYSRVDCFDWIQAFIFNAITASLSIPTCQDAKHALWLMDYPGAFLVKSLQSVSFQERSDSRLEGMRLQISGGL